jgi:hypothetical protein
MAEAGRQAGRKLTDEDKKAPWYSVGSAAHLDRQCKPCAFFHAQGCQSGADCQFCHLCPPREVQRRKRLRRRLAREQVMLDEWAWASGVADNQAEHSGFGASQIQQALGPMMTSSWFTATKPAWEPEPEDSHSSGTSTPPTECVGAYALPESVSRTTSCGTLGTANSPMFTNGMGGSMMALPMSYMGPTGGAPTLFTMAPIQTVGMIPAQNAEENDDSEPGSPTPFCCITDFGYSLLPPTVHSRGEPTPNVGVATTHSTQTHQVGGYAFVPMMVQVPLVQQPVPLPQPRHTPSQDYTVSYGSHNLNNNDGGADWAHQERRDGQKPDGTDANCRMRQWAVMNQSCS